VGSALTIPRRSRIAARLERGRRVVVDDAVQYVRKISGMTQPAGVNQAAFDRAVETGAKATRQLLAELVATSPPHDRTIERQRARARWERRQTGAGPR
jgi:hypothetical protein